MSERRLHAYADGELSRRATRRVERRLEASAEDRAALEQLGRVGEWVREVDAAGAVEVPDLWSRIAPRLAAIDAEHAEARAPRGWLRPVLAGTAMAAAVALVVGVLQLRPNGGNADVVQWLDSEGAPVVVLEGPDDGTIIWVMEPVGGDLSGRVGRVAA